MLIIAAFQMGGSVSYINKLRRCILESLTLQEPPDDAPGDWMGMGGAGREVPSPGGLAQAPPADAAGGAAQGGAADEFEDDDEELLAMQREGAWVRSALPQCRLNQHESDWRWAQQHVMRSSGEKGFALWARRL